MSKIVEELLSYRQKIRSFLLTLDNLIFKKYEGNLNPQHWEAEDRDWFETEEAYLRLLADGIGLSQKGEDRIIDEVKQEIDAESDGEKANDC